MQAFERGKDGWRTGNRRHVREHATQADFTIFVVAGFRAVYKTAVIADSRQSYFWVYF